MYINFYNHSRSGIVIVIRVYSTGAVQRDRAFLFRSLTIQNCVINNWIEKGEGL